MTRSSARYFLLSASLLFTVVLTAAAPSKPATGENQFDVNITLFSTLAAINAAGYDAGLNSPTQAQYPIRGQIRTEIAKRNVPVLADLKEFYRAHAKSDATATLSQYISFALVAGDPPVFELPSGPLPQDVEALRGFGPLLARFFREAHLDDLWKRSQQAYAEAIARYQEPVIGAILEANAYLRNPTSGYLGRRFQIYLDLLGAPEQVQVRSYRDDSYVVITPTNAPVTAEIREAYLAYLLDPLSFKYSKAIEDKKSLQKFAEQAPALDVVYKDDFSLLVTKCLIKAIESRLLHASPEAKQAKVNEAMREGFILSAAFADLLPVYEKQEQAMRLYYPDLVSAIDTRREQRRLKTVQFVENIPPRAVSSPPAKQSDPVEESLETAEGLYEQRDLANAEKAFKRVFQQTSDRSAQGRAYYGLARIAVLQNQRNQAAELFQRVIDAHTEPGITAWAHVFLGRLAAAAGDQPKAREQFKLALAVDGASPKARDAAEKALESASGDEHP